MFVYEGGCLVLEQVGTITITYYNTHININLGLRPAVRAELLCKKRDIICPAIRTRIIFVVYLERIGCFYCHCTAVPKT